MKRLILFLSIMMMALVSFSQFKVSNEPFRMTVNPVIQNSDNQNIVFSATDWNTNATSVEISMSKVGVGNLLTDRFVLTFNDASQIVGYEWREGYLFTTPILHHSPENSIYFEVTFPNNFPGQNSFLDSLIIKLRDGSEFVVDFMWKV